MGGLYNLTSKKMNMERTKHHYRRVMKSDHLGSADLEDFIEEKKPLIFTIDHVNQEFGVSVAGRKGDFNIAYFKEKIKPLVLNSTNAKRVRQFAGGSPFVEDWNNIMIELYVDENVKMKGEIVSGVRIMPTQPKAKTKPAFTQDMFAKAFTAKATIDKIKKTYDVTIEIEKLYETYTKENGTAK